MIITAIFIIHHLIEFLKPHGNTKKWVLQKGKVVLDKGGIFFFFLFYVHSVSHSCEASHAPRGTEREHNSNCTSKLSVHLNYLLPEKDKDTDLQTEDE